MVRSLSFNIAKDRWFATLIRKFPIKYTWLKNKPQKRIEEKVSRSEIILPPGDRGWSGKE
jgi:hypothetical protein